MTDTYTYDYQTRQIDKIEFNILGNDEVKNMSVIKDINGIVKSESYANGEPVIGGLVDRRLGVINPNSECATCGHTSVKCPGHFGHIKLVEAVYHVGYINFVKKILSCICIKCSKLLVYKNETEIEAMVKNKSGKARFNEIRNLCKSVTYCQKANYGCGAPIPKIKLDTKKSTSTINIIAEVNLSTISAEEGSGNLLDGKKKIKQLITPEMCYNILKNISDKDCEIIGLNPKKTRPEMMILKYFPVPPNQVRPSSKTDFFSSISSEDDLTHKLADIINANLRLKKNKEKEDENKQKLYSADNLYLLQYHIATFFENDSSALLKNELRNGHQIKSISSRITSKEGRIRQNLMGKRVDFSARTVIGSDPNLELDELGVPLKMAMNLTFPEVVTPENIERLTELVKNGREKYPGANFIFQANNYSSENKLCIDLRYRKKNIILKIGDTVERHLINGDMVLFNRQPSLHKLSMMAFRIRVINDISLTTFKFSLAVCRPFNADFDGDEMNLHVPQCIQTQIELDLIGSVKRQVINPAKGDPIIGCVQDSIAGVFCLTSDKTQIDWKNVMNLLTYTTELNNILYKVEKNKQYTGNELLSKIIPKQINISNSGVLITDGNIIKGRSGKSIIGAGVGGISHLVWTQYGVNETRQFIDNAQRLINNWLLLNGLTMSYGDTEIPNNINEHIKHIIDSKKLEVNHIITEMENNPQIMDKNIFERNLTGDLTTVQSTINDYIYNNLTDENNFYVTITSESKGSKMNIGQITGSIGQIVIEGVRIKKKVNNRTLYHFHQNDDGATARGFCHNSFVRGLEPHEFYFGMAGGREGVIDTAIKTADSGYISRKLMKALEDLHIAYDGTVRNANGNIIQFIYADSNINSVCLSKQKLNIINMNNMEIEKMYKFTDDEMKNYKSFKNNNKLYEQMVNIRDDLRYIQQKATMNYIVVTDIFMLPVNFQILITNIKYDNIEENKGKENKGKENKEENLDPQYVLDKLEKFIYSNDISNIYMSHSDKNNKESLKYNNDIVSKTLFKYAIYYYLSPKRCINEYKLNKFSFKVLLKKIKNNFKKSKVEPGEMIGAIAAQSIGEPSTQMTLNTFHSSGMATKGTGVLGIPRLKEILNLSKNAQMPKMSIYLNDKIKQNEVLTQQIASYITNIVLNNIISKYDVYYDPLPYNNSFRDSDNVKNEFKVLTDEKVGCQNDITTLPWLLRIILDKEKMIVTNTSLLDIKSKFCVFWKNRLIDLKNLKKEERTLMEKIVQLNISSNYDNSQMPIIHIRFNMTNFNFNTILEFQELILHNFKLKGIENIRSFEDLAKERTIEYKNDGTIEYINQYVIYTSGINLKDIRYINNIDLLKTYTSDIISIYNTFGIEAARSAILKELTVVFVASGSNVIFQHLSVLADFMTNTGSLTSIDRHGINKLDTDPLSRASFEQTVDQLLNAAVFGEVDSMNSVSSKIMVGQVIRGGTGMCDLLIDTNIFENSEYMEEHDKPFISTFNKIKSNTIINDTLDRSDDYNIYMPI
jgi:DNA-directed RNA polymerase II subunit RPB1